MALGALIFVPLILVGPALMIWALIDLLNRPDVALQSVGFNRVIWALVIVFVGFVGPLAYLVVGRNQLEQTAGASTRNPAPPPQPNHPQDASFV